MASTGLQILGLALSVVGWLGAIISCALPIVESHGLHRHNIVVAQTIWEGLWMNCIVQSTGQMQCKVYDSLLALPQDLQAARALTVVSVVVGLCGIFVGIVGAKCTNCVKDETVKAKVAVASGVTFVLAGLLVLVPAAWSANNIIKDFYNPLVTEAQKRELGASIYIAFAAAGLFVLGGALLCCSCAKQAANYPASSRQARPDPTRSLSSPPATPHPPPPRLPPQPGWGRTSGLR
ncbi:claudin-4-like [Heptranchias perlo]|uniref:claudin-4-like n=1 Tax=Heptranchias perlo TaxID=212740 RepID=UPI003559680D